MTDTDAFKFADLKIFDTVKDNLPEGAREISDVYEDLIFVWNFKENNLKVANWRAAQAKQGKYQTLLPSSSPNFVVNKIAVSYGGTFVSLSGPQGVSIMEMPLRWGSDGVYQDGKSRITCQTFHLHEHSTNHHEAIQTRWHPNSPTDSHLLILLSDNSIRIYDEANLKHVWRVGPIPHQAAVEKNLSYLQCLGDTAVDFDIAPPKLKESSLDETADLEAINKSLSALSISKRHLEQQKKIEWPIVILRGNGTIFVLNAGLNSEQPRLQGPLTMVPSHKNNYGDDSCSLLVIPTLPPTLVIAENSGLLHHILMIESPSEDTSLDVNLTILRNDWDLYVLESIELELGLTEERVKESTATPVILKKDPVDEQRYFCYHDTGLHGVTIGFVHQLQAYVNDETESEPNMSVRSRAEYILSTKAFSSAKVNAVVGVGLLQSPSGIFAVLSSGQVVSLNTIKLSLSVIPEVSATAPTMGDQKTVDRKLPFEQHIKTLLQSGVSQPILKLDKSKPPTSQQAFELLTSAIQVLRDNQLKRHDQVRQEIAKRVKILEFMKHQQQDELTQLLSDKELIQNQAYKLADTHEDIMERQQNLQKRVQDILRLASLRLPSGNSSEKDFTEQIRRIKSRTDKLLQDVMQVKSKHELQKQQFENWDNTSEETIKGLPPKQEETIKELLVEMTKQISSLTKDVQKVSSVIDV